MGKNPRRYFPLLPRRSSFAVFSLPGSDSFSFPETLVRLVWSLEDVLHKSGIGSALDLPPAIKVIFPMFLLQPWVGSRQSVLEYGHALV